MLKVKNLRRDLEKLNLGEIRKLAKERGFSKKDAVKYGNAHRRSTWVKLLLVNTPEFHVQPQEKPKQKSSPEEINPRFLRLSRGLFMV
jgi:hypothetical protein